MDIAYNKNTSTIKLAETLAAKVTEFMKELGIKSLKESGYTLEDCLDSAKRFTHDGAFGNSPGNPGIKEIKEYIKYTYEIY